MNENKVRTSRGRGLTVFRRILVGFDGSAEAAHALRIAISLASDLQAEVAALSISQSPVHVETSEDREDELEADARRLREAIDPGRSMANDVGVSFSHTVLEAPRADQALAYHVIEHGFDLLVVGSHGTDHASHGGLGRVAERLLHHQPCPILVIGRG